MFSRSRAISEVRFVEEPNRLLAVRDDVHVCVDIGDLDRTADEEHIRSIVCVDQDEAAFGTRLFRPGG